MPRPTKYSKQRVNRITKAIRELKGRTGAAKAGGIDYTTFLDWMRNKPQFSQAIKEAEREAENTGKDFAKMAIFRAMQEGKWQAAAWWLERNFPHEYAQPDKRATLEAEFEEVEELDAFDLGEGVVLTFPKPKKIG